MPESDGSVQSVPSSPPACSEWARSQHLDPVGSAGYYDGFLLVEQPLPWPFDVASQPELVEVAEVAASARLRLQAVIPVGGTERRRGRGRDAGAVGAAGRHRPAAQDHLLPVSAGRLGGPVGALGAASR